MSERSHCEQLIAKTDDTAGGVVEATEDVEQGGLAASGRSEQHDQFPFVEVDVGPAKGVNLDGAHSIDLGEVARRQGNGCLFLFHGSTLMPRGDWMC